MFKHIYICWLWLQYNYWYGYLSPTHLASSVQCVPFEIKTTPKPTLLRPNSPRDADRLGTSPGSLRIRRAGRRSGVENPCLETALDPAFRHRSEGLVRRISTDEVDCKTHSSGFGPSRNVLVRCGDRTHRLRTYLT